MFREQFIFEKKTENSFEKHIPISENSLECLHIRKQFWQQIRKQFWMPDIYENNFEN